MQYIIAIIVKLKEKKKKSNLSVLTKCEKDLKTWSVILQNETVPPVLR